jgi:hypothetical protein
VSGKPGYHAFHQGKQETLAVALYPGRLSAISLVGNATLAVRQHVYL